MYIRCHWMTATCAHMQQPATIVGRQQSPCVKDWDELSFWSNNPQVIRAVYWDLQSILGGCSHHDMVRAAEDRPPRIPPTDVV